MPPDHRRRFSVAEARRIALAAQGFGAERPQAVINAGHLRREVRRLRLLQLDFVNVLVPAHQLVLFSRLGPFDTGIFNRAMYDGPHFTEQWAHVASIVPMDCWPLLRHRREAYAQSPRSPLFHLRDHRRYLREVLDHVFAEGPLTAADLPPIPGPDRKPGEWHRSIPRSALDHHFGTGHVACDRRLSNFQRVYDVTERLVPQELRDADVPDNEAKRELVARSVAALGIGTAPDIADYFRMTTGDAVNHLGELARAGAVREVRVDGWTETAWLHCNARLPREVDACALLSPFDPVVWFRPRAERLFDFHYRIEIYVPERQRRWGYYVLPFLCGDRLCARVDLKADRQRGQLQVRAAHAEEGIDSAHVARRLAGELAVIAGWLGLTDIRVKRRGDFAAPLAAAVRRVA